MIHDDSPLRRSSSTAAAADAGPCEGTEWLEETKPQVWRKRTGFIDVSLCKSGSAGGEEEAWLRVASWNVCAVNNNPFEYIVDLDDEPAYAALMLAVEALISDPAADVPVSEVFTDAMHAELAARLAAAGVGDADLHAVARFWSALRDQPVVSGFLRDKALGKKRLVSMPDRVTNTIRLAGGGRALRPAVVNACDDDALGSVEAWWPAWLSFMFDNEVALPGANGGDVAGAAGATTTTPFAMLRGLKRAKYPAVTEEEEAVSKPLQALYLAVFDAVMLRVVQGAGPGGAWIEVKRSLTRRMVDGKDERIMRVIAESYASMDVVCLQEVSVAMIDALRLGPLGQAFHVVAPRDASAAGNQNSVVLLKRSRFPAGAGAAGVGVGGDVTDEVRAMLPPNTLSEGDLVAVRCVDAAGAAHLVASFHGDSDGKATVPVLAALSVVAENNRNAGARLVAGVDANSTTPETAARDGKLAWPKLLEEARKLGLTTSFGASPSATNYTSFLARSLLQGQLHKAVPFRDAGKAATKEPKDVILFRPADFRRVKCWKDCTGEGAWRQDAVLPSAHFPSDHALLAAVLCPL